MSFNAITQAGLTGRLLAANRVTTLAIGRSLERLATGSRLNSAADGGADIARVNRIESQVRGLSQAIRNVNDTESMANVAQDGLQTMLDTAYQLRNLAQQATDSSLTAADRTSLSSEAATLLSQLTSLSTGTEFNNMSLLDGTLGTVRVHTGANFGNTFSFAIGDARTSTLGKLAIYSGAQGALTTALGGGASLTLNGYTVAPSGADLVSTVGSSYSAIAIAGAINAQKGNTNVTAEAVGTIKTYNVSFSSGANFTLSGKNFSINNTAITGTGVTNASTLVSKVNAYASTTGVVGTVNASGQVVLTAADGRNIQVTFSSVSAAGIYRAFEVSSNSTVFSSYATLSQGSDQTSSGAVRLWSSQQINISGSLASTAIGMATGSKALVGGTAVNGINLSTVDNSNQAVKVLDATIAQISTLRLNIGDVHDRLDSTASYLAGQVNAQATAKSAIKDADIVTETLNMVMAQFLQNSSLAALAQSNITPLGVLRSLGW